MRINLKVPYNEKELAKRRGARWDFYNETWYIINQEDLTLFKQWIPEQYLRPTKDKVLAHPMFKVTQPRTPRKNNKRNKLR